MPDQIAGLRGRNAPVVKFPLRWAHEYLLSPLPVATFPIDSTEGLVDIGMMGNDQYGNCGACGEVHLEMTTAVAAGTTGPPPTSPLAVNRYCTYVGTTVPPGPGVDLASYLLWCFKQGYIKAFAPVDQTDKATCQAFMQAGFGLYIGVNLTDNNEGQFNAGQPFDPAGQQPDPEDGHCVVWAYSQSATGPHKVGTWGVWWEATDAWIDLCLIQNPGGEAFLVVTTEEQLAKFDPSLLADVQTLGGTGGVPAPPAVTPPPTPVHPNPPPMPAPPPIPPTHQSWFEELLAWLKSLGFTVTQAP